MTKLNKQQFRFRKHETIGTEGAEEDREFLSSCFVDTGDFSVLQDTESPKCIVVGRTGAGKTALLSLLQQREEHYVSLEPDQLSLQYLSNSSIIRHLEELGVELDLFINSCGVMYW
jgi:polynucleotide 5'-kinase involved in rRNA processing